MTSANTIATHQPTLLVPDAEQLKSSLVAAARYALLRRLAPALRHNMAGALQPISMMASMLEKRLQKTDPDMPSLIKNGMAINTLSREAVTACMDLMTWIAPKDNNPVALNTGVVDALGLVTTDLSFRGFTLINETGQAGAEVPRGAIRSVFMASLLALTDATPGAAQVTLTAGVSDNQVLLVISTRLDGSELPAGGSASFQPITWMDVQALADAESVDLRHGASFVELRCAQAETLLST